MMTDMGWVDELLRLREAQNAADLAAAETAAVGGGKEPFDLARLEELLGEEYGSLADREQPLRLNYYLLHPEIRSMARFAELCRELDVWDASGMGRGDAPFD